MTYATQQDLIARFGTNEVLQISDIENTGSIDDTRVTQMLTDATITIDGYLAARYSLPLQTPPPMLNLLCCDIARYRLMTLPTEEVRQRYEDAIKWLTKVGQGLLDLGGATVDAPPPAGGPTAVAGDRVFSRDRLYDFNHPHGLS